MRGMTSRPLLSALALALVACGADPSSTPSDGGAPGDAARDAAMMPRGIPSLGNGAHTIASVRLREVANADDGLSTPRDVAINPEAPEQLWIPNYATNSITIVRNAGTPQRDSVRRTTRGADHFLVRPSAMAFGASGMMATVHETDQITQRQTPANFMGPTLWPTDYKFFDGGHPSHLDMLHNSPNGNGVAWEDANVYWLVDGANRSLTRYDFGMPHEPGGEDHSDGVVRRYAEGMVRFMAGVTAHLEFDRENRVLYMSEPAGNRVARFDPAGAEVGTRILPNYDGSRQNRMNGGTLETFIDGAAAGLRRPSGLALVNNVFYVTDNETSHVVAFDRMGRKIDWVDLSSQIPSGSLQGVAVDSRGYLYLADARGNRVFELAPRDAR